MNFLEITNKQPVEWPIINTHRAETIQNILNDQVDNYSNDMNATIKTVDQYLGLESFEYMLSVLKPGSISFILKSKRNPPTQRTRVTSG